VANPFAAPTQRTTLSGELQHFRSECELVELNSVLVVRARNTRKV